MVTGIDLIKQQIRVAAGEPLPWKQEDIKPRGQCDRVPDQCGRPGPQLPAVPRKITQMYVPGGYGVRFDSHAHAGYVVPAHYDSMIAKLIVHQNTRAEAIDSMKRALRELRIEGIKTTIPRCSRFSITSVLQRRSRHSVHRTNWPA